MTKTIHAHLDRTTNRAHLSPLQIYPPNYFIEFNGLYIRTGSNPTIIGGSELIPIKFIVKWTEKMQELLEQSERICYDNIKTHTLDLKGDLEQEIYWAVTNDIKLDVYKEI